MGVQKREKRKTKSDEFGLKSTNLIVALTISSASIHSISTVLYSAGREPHANRARFQEVNRVFSRFPMPFRGGHGLTTHARRARGTDIVGPSLLSVVWSCLVMDSDSACTSPSLLPEGMQSKSFWSRPCESQYLPPPPCPFDNQCPGHISALLSTIRQSFLIIALMGSDQTSCS